MPSPFPPVPFGASLGPSDIIVVHSDVDRTEMDDPAFSLDGTEICTIMSVGARWPRGEYRVWLVDATGARFPDFGSCFSLRSSSEIDDRFLIEPNENSSTSNAPGVRRILRFALPSAPEGVYGLRIVHTTGALKPISAPSKLRLVRPVRSSHALEMLSDIGRRMSRLSVGKRKVTEG